MVTIPTATIQELNNSITSLSNRINFDQIEDAATQATEELQSALSTSLGVTINENIAGWQGLTQEIDDIEEGVTSVLNRGIALLQDNPPGVELINTFTSGAQSSLQAITGLSDEIQEGLNTVVLSLPTPEAIGSSLNVISELPLDELRSAMSEIAPAAIRDLSASSAISQLTDQGIFRSFENTVNTISADVESFLNGGFGQTVKDLIEATTNPIGFAVDQLTQDAGSIISDEIKRNVASFIDQGDFLNAATVLSSFTNTPLEILETELSEIDTSVNSLINRFNPAFDLFGTSTAPISNIGSNDGNWTGSSTVITSPGATSQSTASGSSSGSYTFTFISSMEELEAELRSATREITETVIHWTGNYIDQPHIGSEEVHSWHLDRGWSGCGYHYIIKRDGTIQRGRPINIQGAHAGNLNHNRYSIGISHVAGYNCVSGTPNPNRFISAESISDPQWRAQRDFLEVFYRVFPGGQVLGHNQTDDNKIDPGFDVDAYILNTFNKRNAFVYNRDRGPLSRAELIQARQVRGVS